MTAGSVRGDASEVKAWPLVLAVLFVMTGVALVAPILPLYGRQFGVSRTAAGALISAFALARLAFDLVGGVAGDRFGARRVTVAGCLLLSAGSVAAALAPSYAVLVAARVLEGTGSAAFATAAMQYLIKATPRERLGRTVALFQGGLLVGIAVGPFLGGHAARLGDFTTPFWMYAGMSLVAAGISYRYVSDVPPSGHTVAEVLRVAGRLARRPAFLVVMFVSFSLFVMRAGARVTLLPLYAGEVLGLDEGRIGEILSIAAVTNLAVVNPGGRLVDSVGRRPVALVGLGLTAVAITAYGLVDTYLALLAVSAGLGLSAGLASIPPPTMVGDLAPDQAEGSAVGLYRTSGDLGFVVGPVLLGAFADGGHFLGGFAVSAALLLVAALLVGLMPDTRDEVARPAGIVDGP